MTKREQLTELIGYFAHGNKSEFGRLLDITPSCVTAWLRRDTFDAELITEKLPDVNSAWLLLGEGEMIREGAVPPANASDTNTMTQKQKQLLALIDFYTKGSKSSFAKLLCTSPSTISTWLQRDTLPHETILRYLPDVNPAWLLKGEGEMIKEKSGNIVQTAKGEPAQVLVTRPHLPISAAAGLLSGISEGVTPAQCEQMPLVPHTPDYDFTISIRGDSMEPEFHGGDILAVKRVREFVEWGKPHIIDCAEGALLKVVYEESETQYRFVSLNREKYPDIVANRSCVSALFKIVAVLRTYD